MTSIFHFGLSKDFSLILNDDDDFNVIIQAGENQNMKEFKAHSVILRARSPYFKTAFSTKCITKKDNMIMFNKPNITSTIFEMILKYIYTGQLDLTKWLGENILELLGASDELLLEELFDHLQDYLIEKRARWIQQNLILVTHTAFKFANCKKLQDYCLGSTCEDPYSFITSKNFLSLDKVILYDLFKREYLQIEEVVAWNYLVKWGIEQIPGLKSKNSNIAKWNNRDYKALEKILNQFIPLIRFVEMSSTDFFYNVRPYKAIIPNQIYKEAEEFFCFKGIPKPTIISPRKKKVATNIIKPKLLNIIANWIDKNNFGVVYNSHYKFHLIYRSSRDKINSKSFRDKCKGQVASLVLIKVQQSDEIFGGYSSIGFNSIGSNLLFDDSHRQFYHSLDNFIFSFKNSEDTQDMKISRVVNHFKAIVDLNGFNFGCGSLTMVDQNLYHSNNGNYENNLNTDTIYTIEEIETFTVIKQ